MLSVLKNRDFFWLWLGQAISQVGDGIRDFAMIYWVFNTSGHSPVIQSLSFIVVIVPQVVLAPIAGVWVDRWDRRRTMVIADLVRGGLSLALIAASVAGQYWYALGLTFLASCVAQFFNPARGAMIPRVVGREHLLQANALSQTTSALLQVAGPALGTTVYLYLGARSSFLVDAFSFFASALCIALVAVSGAVAAAPGRPNFLSEMKSGLAFVWRTTPVRASWLGIFTMMFGAGAINALTIFVIRMELKLPEETFGYVMSVQPMATLAAAMVVGGMAKRIRRVPLLIPLGLLLGALGIGAIAAALNIGWLLVGSVLVGLCNAVLNIGLSMVMQTCVPDEIRGRVLGSAYAIPMAGMVLSAGLAGYLAQSINPRLILGGADIFLLLGAVVAFAGLRTVVLPTPQGAAKSAT
ncbi:MAG TPA: MFS transporter [Symbiobacteriaceae bacterium]|nr:MFS transporter [Symbiobacteriaceae bacterium]